MGKIKTKVIADSLVFHIWKDTDTGEEIAITPDWYEENGTPITVETGEDCKYLRTEIVVRGADDPVFVCEECGSEEIEATYWADVNTKQVTENYDPQNVELHWCRNCEKHTKFIEKK